MAAIIVIGDSGIEVARYIASTLDHDLIISPTIPRETLLDVGSNFHVLLSATTRDNDYSIELLKEKQPCFTERGHDWWFDVLPIPKKDIRADMIPCGDRSPPWGGSKISSM